MQEVLLKSIPHLAKFESPQALTVWLYRVARNHCVSRRRGDKNSPAKNLSLDELMPDGRELRRLMSRTLSPEAAALNHETAEHLQQAIFALPPAYRMVLVLHDMEELPTSEVAQVLGIRDGTVRVRLHRARLFVTAASGSHRHRRSALQTRHPRQRRAGPPAALPPPVCRAVRLHGRDRGRRRVRGDGPAHRRLRTLPGISDQPAADRGAMPLVCAQLRFRASRRPSPGVGREIPGGRGRVGEGSDPRQTTESTGPSGSSSHSGDQLVCP